MITETISGLARRKTAVASVRLRPGNGQPKVNGKAFEVYFPLAIQRDTILAPIKEIDKVGTYDLIVTVRGGGIEGQVIATRLGIARALVGEEGRASYRSLDKRVPYT